MSETPHPTTWTIGEYLEHLDSEHADESDDEELQTIVADLVEREKRKVV
jgi:hypothetical protein